MIAVIGAGPAGLAAAWRAARAGHDVVVVERAPAVGGMAGSFEVAGLRVDHGSHRLHPATPPPILDALRGLLGRDLQTRPRHGRIRLLDRWLAFPLRTGDLVRRAPRRFAARAAFDAATGPVRRPRADTFGEVVRAGLGPAVLDSFYGPYARKLWDADPADLAGELARRRVGAASPTDILRRLARGARPEGRVFLYPRRGFGAIAEAVAGAAADAGADLRLGCGARSLAGGPGGWTVTLDDGSAIDAAQVWSTAPLPALAQAVDPPPPPGALAAAGRLRHRAMVLLYVVVDRPRWTEFDAHYFPGPEVVAARVSEPRNYRDDPTQPADRTVLCAEIACWEGDELWRAGDADLAARLAAELAALGLPEPVPAAAESRRLPRVYPVYGPGFAADLGALEAWATGLDGLVTFGRQGLFTPDNTHHALAMGWAAAECLRPDGTLDHDRWVAARDGFRRFVVED
ncbi:MAG TPA: FAD-dependent oxidoreductase [Acidimicrobiales bacterium]|nr:FAD-dependent oxidoreductase [Acidimicrobiales bacterium]